MYSFSSASGIDSSFLTFYSMPPHLYLTAETEDFDAVIMQHWREEGKVTLPAHHHATASNRAQLTLSKASTSHTSPSTAAATPTQPHSKTSPTYASPSSPQFLSTTHRAAHAPPQDLEAGESYGLIAYGAPASTCLSIHTEPQPHLAVLVCYYPPSIADPRARCPAHLQLVVHLAGSQGFNPAFASYTYPGTEPGFAEHDLGGFDKVAAGLAWSRSLGAVRRGFGVEVDLEGIWEGHVQGMFFVLAPPTARCSLVKRESHC